MDRQLIPISSYETILRPSRLRCSAIFCWKLEEDMVMVIPEWAGTRLLDSVWFEPYSALACLLLKR